MTVLSSDIENNKKIIIYGFGPYGEELFVNLFFKNRIVGIYDKDYKSKGIYIESPDKIDSSCFDFVIVTVMNENARKSIVDFLKKKNISEEKIILVNYL